MVSAHARAIAALFIVWIGGCTARQTPLSYHTVFTPGTRNRDAAEAANEQGLRFAESGDYRRAEGAFREALRADVTYAAAHNNLGLVLFSRGNLHESALEFSFAHKLDAQAPEPLINLGRLYESVGWYESAVAQYEEALALDEGSVEAMGRLAYVYARTGEEGNKAERLLHRLAQSETDREWKGWALAQLAEHGPAAK